ncbi:hypothetical protein [Okeania sp. KiyG1]|uniref:hypothetical protein n=1 Tax=Okeania sp. KiyG1 TaxID=2720165 RepID=UPI0019215558|nr:hypothetical protein [Okeania sp. KiyG1]GGA18705.1 hypothetical protein CYANOKiyG1_33210 [Okeania sp. KiyG1]
MNLPIQAPPTLREVSTAKLSGIRAIDPSNLACDLCCQLAGGEACSAIPGCSCEI